MPRDVLFGVLATVQVAGCYSSSSEGHGGDGGAAEGLTDAGDRADEDAEDPDAPLPDGLDAPAEVQDDGLDGDGDHPDHLPDGVEYEQVVVPLPVVGAEPCDTDGWGGTCRGPFICCRDGTGSGKCVDPNIARRHCGGCGKLCPYPAQCTEGVCVAPPGFRFCGCAWSDPLNDSDNCGRCGNACPDGAMCVEGWCSSIEDATSCGAYETLCGSGCTTTAQLNTCLECGHRCVSSGAGFGGRENIAGDCHTMCGQCDDPDDWSLGYWGSRVPWFLDWPGTLVTVPDSRTGCEPGEVAWLGGACLVACPEGTAAEPWSFYLFDGVEEGTGCRPFSWSDSGAGWLYDSYPEDWPWCGGPHLPCAGSGSACRAGSCECMEGYSRCNLASGGWLCTDKLRDGTNCGTCGNGCSPTERCDGGTCVPAG